MSPNGFALTICAYRKPGMDEEEYHKYISERHAPALKDLLVKNKIISYTMVAHLRSIFLTTTWLITAQQHNTSETKKYMGQIFGEVPDGVVADHDCFIQIVFKDIQDYLQVLDDPHFQNVVAPDHSNFADSSKTKMVTGWFEPHVMDGQAV